MILDLLTTSASFRFSLAATVKGVFEVNLKFADQIMREGKIIGKWKTLPSEQATENKTTTRHRDRR